MVTVDVTARALMSPSSWRAWVEIFLMAKTAWITAVALLVEGVGRNLSAGADIYQKVGRPPRGGRG